MRRFANALQLARWLGPWADDTVAPSRVKAAEGELGGVRVRWYRRDGEPVSGPAYVLVSGLHFLGPKDPRFDRLARVLALTGRPVVAPFLTDYLQLRASASVVSELERVVGALCRDDPSIEPVLFSISFGALPALSVAGGTHRDRVRSAIVFGGYADWESAVIFALTGEDVNGERRPADPLNRPVVFSNLVDHIPSMAPFAEPLREAWFSFCVQTWGQAAMREPAACEQVARAVGQRLSGDQREAFLVGCGVGTPAALAEGEAACRAAMANGDWSHLDPRPAMQGIRCPVHVIHGVGDDVIPHTQLDAILAALPDPSLGHAYRTGLYAHTSSDASEALPLPLAAQAREGWTMVRMLGALTA